MVDLVTPSLSYQELRSPATDTFLLHSLAYLEMRMILARMFWKYDLDWSNAEDFDWERDTKGYTLWEKPELRCLFREKVN